MFKLLGADQQEYGPVSPEQIREWIVQGRANAQTKLQAAGSTDWKPLAEFPEFADALRQPTSAETSSPLLAAGIPTGAAPPKTSGLAVTSLVLGLLGLLSCGLTALVGLVLGFMALSRIKHSNGQLGGQGLAMAGTIVSAACALLVVPVLLAMLLPALGKAKQKASGVQCMNNVKQLNLGVIMYADDNKDTFPSGTTWCDALTPYLGNSTRQFVCPLGAPNQRCHYALNSRLVGVSLKEIQSPAQTVLIFEIDGGWNLSGGRELLPAKGRHSGAYAFGFADGHAEIVRPERLANLRWEP
jgi:prepilin-type processing-associated H-X9-DG protein